MGTNYADFTFTQALQRYLIPLNLLQILPFSAIIIVVAHHPWKTFLVTTIQTTLNFPLRYSRRCRTCPRAHIPCKEVHMPYILKEKRTQLDPAIQQLAEAFTGLHDDSNFAGNLNYTITKLLTTLYPEPNYQRFNDMIGALECCKLELYRKKIAPYEDLKEQDNGPV